MPLVTAGATLIAQALIGETYTAYNSSNAFIGVGDGTASFSASHTDLQGTNKVRKGMESGYPQRSANQLTFQALFGTSEANFTWNEWGIFNASTGGTMLNRKVESLGTKNSSQTWRVTVTITISA